MTTPSKIDVLSEILRSVELHGAGDDSTHGSILNAASTDPFSVLFAYEHGLKSRDDVRIQWFSRGLENIIERCKVISFSDWASVDGVSDVWDRFRERVIKPAGRRDLEFIFYLGSASTKPSYEVDEVLDIISDFSLNGKVTLVLTNKECNELWNLLTGKNDNWVALDGDSNLKGQYIFNAMNIHRLLVYSPDHRMTIFSDEGRQDWKDRELKTPNLGCRGRDAFNTGYIFGLITGLKTIHCTALGLAISGAHLRDEAIADVQTLQRYLNTWIDELDRQLVES